MVSDTPPVDERRQALERVLESRTFSRSERLRAFLRYVCEAEFEGRAQQINEYALGVSVLGRSPEYSPAEDSSVRTRAYELRNKLRSYYESEGADDPLQIEIDKGAYVPRFVRRQKAVLQPAASANAGVATPVALHVAPATDTRRRVGPIARGAVALVVVAGALVFLARSRPPAPAKALHAPGATHEMEA